MRFSDVSYNGLFYTKGVLCVRISKNKYREILSDRVHNLDMEVVEAILPKVAASSLNEGDSFISNGMYYVCLERIRNNIRVSNVEVLQNLDLVQLVGRA
jgi:hypothetical protein